MGGSLLDMRYLYDPVGNIRIITDTSNSGQALTFTYDALDRLTRGVSSAVGAGQYDQSFAYSPTCPRSRAGVGNLTTMAGTSQWYSDTTHVHAVTHLGGTRKFWYDATCPRPQPALATGRPGAGDGNEITRTVGAATYTQIWDAENRLASITAGGVVTTYTYNGDGARVKVASGGSATVYVGNTYEVITSTGVTTTYYYLGATRVAMRTSAGVTYLVGHHLGSASLACRLGQASVKGSSTLRTTCVTSMRRCRGSQAQLEVATRGGVLMQRVGGPHSPGRARTTSVACTDSLRESS